MRVAFTVCLMIVLGSLAAAGMRAVLWHPSDVGQARASWSAKVPAMLVQLDAASNPTSKEDFLMTRDRASAFAKLALKGIRQEYPNHPTFVLNDDADVKPPRKTHPAFSDAMTGIRPFTATGCSFACCVTIPICRGANDPRRALRELDGRQPQKRGRGVCAAEHADL